MILADTCASLQYYVGATTPLYQDLIGWRLYPMHAGFCLISFITVYFVYPETARVPLEVCHLSLHHPGSEIDLYFRTGNGCALWRSEQRRRRR